MAPADQLEGVSRATKMISRTPPILPSAVSVVLLLSACGRTAPSLAVTATGIPSQAPLQLDSEYINQIIGNRHDNHGHANPFESAHFLQPCAD